MVNAGGLAGDVVEVAVDCGGCVEDVVAYTCVGSAGFVLVCVLRVFCRTLDGLYSKIFAGSGTSLSS